MFARTNLAFEFSAQRLSERSEHLYFWTFTFKKTPIDDETGMKDWDNFRSRVCKVWPNLKGLRVVELHRSHGIHFHALVNMRIPIERVKRVAHGSGKLNGYNRYLDFGRMSVAKCDSGTSGYMAKYLTKQYREDYNFGSRRRWGTIGGFDATGCRDIEYDTPYHRNKPLLFGAAQIDYATMLVLSHYTTLWGDLANWPAVHKMRVMNFATATHSERRETQIRKPQSERIDPDYMFWKGHLEMCSVCRYGNMLCPGGLKLWHKSIFANWVFPETSAVNVAECNKLPDRDVSEVEERDSEKNFLRKGCINLTTLNKTEHPGLQAERDSEGRRVYVLRPADVLQGVTEVENWAEQPF